MNQTMACTTITSPPYSHSIQATSILRPKKGSHSYGSFRFRVPNLDRFFAFGPGTSKINSSMEEEDRNIVANSNERNEQDKKKVKRLLELKVESNHGQGTEKQNGDGICNEKKNDFSDCEHDGVPTEAIYDRESFSRLLFHVPFSDVKLFSKLAFLCDMAYAIPETRYEELRVHLINILAKDLRMCHGLHFVASSLKTKTEATNTEAKLEVSLQSPNIVATPEESSSEKASTSTDIAPVPVLEIKPFHSSPFQWFICDDPKRYSRIIVIQGPNSLASWKPILFLEPARFEGKEVLVHKGIYEAAKVVYDQVMPKVVDHLQIHGDNAKLQFTGHSLGGSISVLVSLMLLTRNVIRPSTLQPVVTFGSPFVLCGGEKLLDELMLGDNQIHNVMMHRDIVPRSFSCKYPDYLTSILSLFNSSLHSHPCLIDNKILYSPIGKLFILQPADKTSAPCPSHPLLPPGNALYALGSTKCGNTNAISAFLNCPHPLETLFDLKAYGNEGTVLRDHDSSSYLKAINGVTRKLARMSLRRPRKERSLLWPLLASPSPRSWSHGNNLEARS